MISRLFTLPPIVYFVLAPVALALGIGLYVLESGNDAERAAALSHAAPEMVEIQSLTSDDSGSDFNEIVVAGQADVNNMIEMVRTRRGSERGRALFIPLHSTEATDLTAPAIAIIEIDGTVSDEQLEQFYAGDGPAGPVLVVNGVLSGGFNKDAQEAMSGNAELAADFYTIKPFMNGREEGLKVTGGGPIMAILGLILALILGGYGYFRKKREEKLIAEAQAFYAEAESAELQQGAEETPDPDSETGSSDGPR